MNSIKTNSANQRIIHLIRELADYSHPYAIINLAARTEARSELSGNAFKLYDYLCMADTENSSNRSVLVPQHIIDCTGLSEHTYYRMFKELEEKGYITPDTIHNEPNAFFFFENKHRSVSPK